MLAFSLLASFLPPCIVKPSKTIPQMNSPMLITGMQKHSITLVTYVESPLAAFCMRLIAAFKNKSGFSFKSGIMVHMSSHKNYFLFNTAVQSAGCSTTKWMTLTESQSLCPKEKAGGYLYKWPEASKKAKALGMGQEARTVKPELAYQFPRASDLLVDSILILHKVDRSSTVLIVSRLTTCVILCWTVL